MLASVDGQDITKRDVATELDAQPADAAGGSGRDHALAQLVDRALLVRVAQRRRLDLTPEYLASLRRMRAQLLVSMLTDEVAAELPQPSPAQVAQLIAGRPWMFGQREYLRVDQLATAALPGDERRFAGVPSLDDVTQSLRQAGRRYVASSSVIDSATLPPSQAQRLTDTGAGTPVVSSAGATTRVVAIRRRAPAAIAGIQAAVVARLVLRREAIAAAVGKLLAAERKQANVRYQAGTGPYAGNLPSN
ncbi:hypothetical protein EAH87_14780 [Sphingomonas koreensis]|nr:hypothetical protein EAH87_14780 [Sphingomonas koreensis]